jgi:hypothetical protein
MEEEIQDFVRSGANLVVTKPMKVNFLTMLLRLIEQHGSVSKADRTLHIQDEELVWSSSKHRK